MGQMVTIVEKLNEHLGKALGAPPHSGQSYASTRSWPRASWCTCRKR